MSKKKTIKKIGFIQSRGLGDIVIALPIANEYRKQGWDVYWPIGQSFVPSFIETVPWVHWIPISESQTGAYFYDEPLRQLYAHGVEDIICLYQSLTGHPELTTRTEFQITKFDQLKYHATGVPFLKKWTLDKCITRNPEREQRLKERLVNKEGRPYVVIHTQGSDHQAQWDPSWIPTDWQTIEISPMTDCIFDWLTIIEEADAFIAVDSVYSNIVDQMNWTDRMECYFIPRSHIQLTPVLGGSWTTLDPGEETLKRISIFKIG